VRRIQETRDRDSNKNEDGMAGKERGRK